MLKLLEIQTIKSYLFVLGLLLVLVFCISGCVHTRLSKAEKRVIRSSSYMKGYIHGQSTCKGNEGHTEFQELSEELESIR